MKKWFEKFGTMIMMAMAALQMGMVNVLAAGGIDETGGAAGSSGSALDKASSIMTKVKFGLTILMVVLIIILLIYFKNKNDRNMK